MNTDTQRALTTVEAAERIATRAATAIQEGNALYALALLGRLTDMASTTTCSLVKDQTLSDAIAKDAREHVAAAVAHAEFETAGLTQPVPYMVVEFRDRVRKAIATTEDLALGVAADAGTDDDPSAANLRGRVRGLKVAEGYVDEMFFRG